jgi:hypothetical protein
MTIQMDLSIIMAFAGAFGLLFSIIIFFRDLGRKVDKTHTALFDDTGVKPNVDWLVKAHRNADDYGFGTTTINAELREMRKSMARQVALQAMVAEHITDKPLPKWAKDALNGGSDPGTRT